MQTLRKKLIYYLLNFGRFNLWSAMWRHSWFHIQKTSTVSAQIDNATEPDVTPSWHSIWAMLHFARHQCIPIPEYVIHSASSHDICNPSIVRLTMKISRAVSTLYSANMPIKDLPYNSATKSFDSIRLAFIAKDAIMVQLNANCSKNSNQDYSPSQLNSKVKHTTDDP